jgi:ABC-2 type transport system ATP-binding protein
MALIEVRELVKEFTVTKKKSGLKGSIAGLFHAEKSKLKAVDGISFDIEQGDIVGYIGPNGAGKSTTIKMLTGILHPTSGTIRIDGVSPQKDRKAVVQKLGVVFGQRTQLYWDLRLGESFELLKRIYRIDHKVFQDNMNMMHEVLKINEIVDTPVRQLSLGQRMRGDLAAAMLHSPSILFLDEPTIGLDVDAKHAIRKFIKGINQMMGTTVILTTHDLDDVEQLCKRLIVVNHGKVVEDGPLQSLIDKLAPYRLLVIDLAEPVEVLQHPIAEVVKQEGQRISFRFDRNQITAAQLISDLSQMYPIQDLGVKEPDIEAVIREVYKVS